MKTDRVRRIGLGVAVMLASALAGCATKPQPLYHWGDYQPQVYAYFKGDGESPEAQQSKLEATAQQAQAKGAALPPGFNAHLGLLYLKAGQADKARTAFRTEEAQFPESKPYMDFLLKNFDAPKAGEVR
ncbi:MAG: DUF4810 domain-containing protein [Panacagrimonas sp.]